MQVPQYHSCRWPDNAESTIYILKASLLMQIFTVSHLKVAS